MKTNFETAIRAAFAASALMIAVLIVGSALSDERDLAVAFAASPGNDVTPEAVRFADLNRQTEEGTGRAAPMLLSKAQ
jgi:hypothetical protein